MAAFAAITRSLTAVIGAVTLEIDRLAAEMTAAFDQHPDAAIYRSQAAVAAVAEHDAARASRGAGRGRDTGRGGEGVVAGETSTGVADLGAQGRGAHASRAGAGW